VISVYSTACRFDNPRWNLSKKEQIEYINDILNRSEVVDFLPTADLRRDVLFMYEVVKSKDAKAIMKARKKERFKESVRNNKVLVSVYRRIRGN
jgi:hypothetical protein